MAAIFEGNKIRLRAVEESDWELHYKWNMDSDNGRMTGLVNSIPVRVILDDKTALYGAARYALSTD